MEKMKKFMKSMFVGAILLFLAVTVIYYFITGEFIFEIFNNSDFNKTSRPNNF